MSTHLPRTPMPAPGDLLRVSGGASATFTYDGDGNLVKKTLGTANTSYVGSHFEWMGSTSAMVKYCYFAGKRVAMRNPTGLSYIHSDHLGSATNTAGITAPPGVPPAAPRRGGQARIPEMSESKTDAAQAVRKVRIR